MNPADDLETTFARWQDAERAVLQAQDEFDRALHLYLLGRGPAPARDMADALADRRRDAMRTLATAHEAVRRCRSVIRIL